LKSKQDYFDFCLDIKDIPYITIFPVETNIVIAQIKDEYFEEGKRTSVILRSLLKERGVLVTTYGLSFLL
jgi:hypothetical protein